MHDEVERHVVESPIRRAWIAGPILEQPTDTPPRKIDYPLLRIGMRNSSHRGPTTIYRRSRRLAVTVGLGPHLQNVHHPTDV